MLLLNWGLASVFPNLNAAMGFTGNFQLDKQGEVQGTGTGTTWCVDAGITFNPKEKSRFSLAVFQILNNIDAVGAGYALDLGKSATFVIDGAHTTSQGTIILKPGINMALDNFQLSSSFGFRVLKQSGWTWIRPGLTAGLGVNVNDRIRIEGYFNHFARAMGTLTVRL